MRLGKRQLGSGDGLGAILVKVISSWGKPPGLPARAGVPERAVLPTATPHMRLSTPINLRKEKISVIDRLFHEPCPCL